MANGSEDIEVIATSEVLNRESIDVVIAGMDGLGSVKLAHKAVILPDKSLADAKTTLYGEVIIPCGIAGAKALSINENVKEILYNHHENKKIIGSICTGPLVLSAFGIVAGSTLTSYSFVEDQLTNSDYNYKEERIFIDRSLVTSRGPGTAVEFGLALVEILKKRLIRFEFHESRIHEEMLILISVDSRNLSCAELNEISKKKHIVFYYC